MLDANNNNIKDDRYGKKGKGALIGKSIKVKMLICMGVRNPESFVEGEIYNEQLQTNATCYGNTHITMLMLLVGCNSSVPAETMNPSSDSSSKLTSTKVSLARNVMEEIECNLLTYVQNTSFVNM